MDEKLAEANLLPVLDNQAVRVVVQHNALAEARYRLSLRAQKLLIRLIAELDQRSDDFSEVKLGLSDFAEFAAQERNDVTFAHFIEAAEQFLGRFVAITQPPVPGEAQARQLVCHWISSLEKNPNDKSITFSFDKKLKPYLLGLKRSFFVYRTLYAFNLGSAYGIRLYQWAKSRQYLKRPQQMSVEELRCSLGTIEFDARGHVIKESLKRYADFKRVALKPALKEINEKTDITLVFKELKQPGTKIVVALVFSVRQKETPLPSDTAFRFPEDSQFELALRATEEAISPEDPDFLENLRASYQLSEEQIGKIKGYIKNRGLGYVREKLTLTEMEPRENAARYLLAALRDDFKPPVKLVPEKKKQVKRPAPSLPLEEVRSEQSQAIAAQKLRELRQILANTVSSDVLGN
jgi:plasmid replication initiation protein